MLGFLQKYSCFQCVMVGPGGVSLPSVTNNLGWQTILTAHVDPKCNLAAVANPSLNRRPDPGKVLNVRTAKRHTCCPARISATRTAVPNTKLRRSDRAAAP